MSESRTFARKNGIGAEAKEKKGLLHNEGRQVSRRRERASKENFSIRSRRKHERASGSKSSSEGPAESWFHFKSVQT